MNLNTPVREWRQVAAWRLFQGSLFTLSWVGVGVIRLATGRDLGAGLQPSWLLLCAVVVMLAPELLQFLGQTRRAWSVAAGPLLLALVLSVVGLWVAPSGEALTTTLSRFVRQVIQVAVMMFFVIVPAYYLVRGRRVGSLARPVVWGALFQLIYSAVQGIHFYQPMALMAALEQGFTSNPAILAGSEQLYLSNALQQIPRLRGTVCEPLYLGNFLLLAVPLVALTEWAPRWRRLVAVLLAALLVLTWSRGAWLAAAGGGLFWIVLSWRSGCTTGSPRLGRWLWGTVAVAVVVAGVGVLSGRPEVWLPWRRLQQSFSMVDWSNLTRLYSMQAAWRAFLLSPLVGVGWGQFGFHFAALADPMGLQSMFSWPVVNNLPLKILCETGCLGATGLVWLVARVGRSCRAQIARLDRTRCEVHILLMASTVAIGMQLLTFSQYNLPHIWTAAGLLVGVLAVRSPDSGEDVPA